MLVDCRSMAREVEEAVAESVRERTAAGRTPALREIVATANEGVRSYVRTKAKKAAALGVDYAAIELGAEAGTEEVRERVEALNRAPEVHGIMLGLPMFPHLDADGLADSIAGAKDIDGLGARNTAYLATGREALAILPATAVAAVHILERLGPVAGKRVAVLGRGRTVGRPVAAMLTNRDATVTLCHSRSRDLPALLGEHEIVVSAVGKPHFLAAEWLREGQVVVDCGISFADGRTVGDVDSAAADARGAVVTPVPGGVGTVTNAILFANLLRAMDLQQADRP
ncbi:MAG: bifunctional 5,10-methylenetetrahydrofolate dehydrogenase/5,10-methenyltetrahydrofolate cyclohydrolase [Alphaproteobacteria bacterium]|nr:bifunctional 5,10-methylenetetrahydrofolate dehydrogenase/5,10-methenyltetrahydrofolate cyclohydrolase [Alphaproteobacteria bacterium]MBV9370225.1 bifunctional 5,10-methylenetetrahydrofolate dehydrogenase/5,10-methenyltetrahydrofolate cyclohydrolase [Alphaproteobacteria bacterium]MBV9899710.1 bifunctional 5,10-methylenetetrahydrofolate dehydrogenase/5,10-methenyltetrahydrofolate cyclohydrolase [Alphaproteobacteria bacterium]